MRLLLVIFIALLPAAVFAKELTPEQKLARIHHIIVFYPENHSFDNLLGTFPGADGIANAGNKAVQVDVDGKPYPYLPAVKDGKKIDPRFPQQLPNKPFLISQYVPANELSGDLIHRFYQIQEQFNGGAMNKFALVSDAGGLTMGHYDGKDSPLWQYAQRYTLADHFFVGAFGGSMLNHFWLVCACTPQYANAPKKLHAKLDANGDLLKDGELTPDGYAVNTIQPFNPPYDTKVSHPETRLPPAPNPTIGERLDEKKISWAWYSQGWDDAIAGKPDPTFIFHHQPFTYFAKYGPGTEGRKNHLKDEKDFIAAIENGTLPAVSFYKPIGKVDMHPGYSILQEGEEHIFALIQRIENSPLWKDTVIIVVFDDAGGYWDHVPPPKGDRFGPGERVPALLISPFVRRGYIDHTTYDTTSVLKLIETKYHLAPLGKRDASAGDLTHALK